MNNIFLRIISVVLTIMFLQNQVKAQEEQAYYDLVNSLNEPILFHGVFDDSVLVEADTHRFFVYNATLTNRLTEKCWAKLPSYGAENSLWHQILSIPNAFEVADKEIFRTQALLKQRASQDAAWLVNTQGCDGLLSDYILASNDSLDRVFNETLKSYGLTRKYNKIADFLFDSSSKIVDKLNEALNNED